MKALEFKTRIKNNQIQIPIGVQSELKSNKDKDIRVIVLLDDSDIYNDFVFQETTSKQFLKGYADSDSIYDSY
ncbi:unnamed protein product [marine sediment metagenome]|uniref:Uncharacterized protein n=1 Tax=marine sediment metagenome TaxID=412755 RepID=X1GIC2_9ZZZZ